MDALIWLVTQMGMGVYNFGYAITHPWLWLDWSNKESLMRFIYYGGSVELFFALFDGFLMVTLIGMYFRPFMWACVRILEGVANTVGRTAAWAGLVMVAIQTMVVFLQSIFRLGEITVAPLGLGLTYSVTWWSEGLKFWNAVIVALCVSYTFVQGGHVRVDLIYAPLKHRAKRMVDMFGALFLMVPTAILTWMYAWFFLWRHLITPKVSASDKLELLERKARIVKWKVETIGFSPDGFNAYFLFKVLILCFVALVLVQAIAFFYRSYLELIEGEASAGKYLDRDTLGEGEEAFEGTH
ncbi:TRAP transporter small permease subunit [Pseudooceanicola sp.]|uniref:TRAP transporter small permease subunit n=1 Tax=Pseudooceanicola sp. TaxID=1914328 RepID=UPI0026130A67|nr:TRAP transporter small permease subunit [Pseudooceanicola sp.]MDF1854042.1 C4-dicarboxylate ABC transporter permease [Pseudooceanicola sp.]